MSEFDLFDGWAKLIGHDSLVKAADEDAGRKYSVKTDQFAAAFPGGKPETKEELYFSLLRELTPGLGAKKWQKTLRIP